MRLARGYDSKAATTRSRKIRNQVTHFLRDTEDRRTDVVRALDAWTAYPCPSNYATLHDAIDASIQSWDRLANFVAETVPRKRDA